MLGNTWKFSIYIYMEIPWGYFDVSKNAAFTDLHKLMTFTREKKMMMNRGIGVCASQKGDTKRTADRELRRPTSFWVSCWGKAFQHLQPARDRQQDWPSEAFLYGPFSNEIGCVCMYTFLSTYTCDNFLYIDQSIYIYIWFIIYQYILYIVFGPFPHAYNVKETVPRTQFQHLELASSLHHKTLRRMACNLFTDCKYKNEWVFQTATY